MNKTLLPLLVSSFALFFVGCSDDETFDASVRLPEETQIGANTFGCLINGKVLVPRDGSGTVMGSDPGFIFWGDPTLTQQYNEIDVHDYKSDRTASIFIHIQNIHQLGEGTYIIDESNGMTSIDGYMHNYIHCRIWNNATNSYSWYRSYHNSGTLNISKFGPTNQNIDNRIVSGNFNCRVVNSVNQNDTIDITFGRFDINKSTITNAEFP